MPKRLAAHHSVMHEFEQQWPDGPCLGLIVKSEPVIDRPEHHSARGSERLERSISLSSASAPANTFDYTYVTGIRLTVFNINLLRMVE